MKGNMPLRRRRPQPLGLVQDSQRHAGQRRHDGRHDPRGRMAFDPKDRLLLVVNNAETPPFATHIQR
jgi:hypothetical protein